MGSDGKPGKGPPKGKGKESAKGATKGKGNGAAAAAPLPVSADFVEDDVGDEVGSAPDPADDAGEGKGNGIDGKGNGKGEGKGNGKDEDMGPSAGNIKGKGKGNCSEDRSVLEAEQPLATATALSKAEKLAAMKAKMAALSADDCSATPPVPVPVPMPEPEPEPEPASEPEPTAAPKLSKAEKLAAMKARMAGLADADTTLLEPEPLATALAPGRWLSRLHVARLRLALAVACNTERRMVPRPEGVAGLDGGAAYMEPPWGGTGWQAEASWAGVWLDPRGLELRGLALRLELIEGQHDGQAESSSGESSAESEDSRWISYTGEQWWWRAVAAGNDGMGAVDQLLTATAALLALSQAPPLAAEKVGAALARMNRADDHGQTAAHIAAAAGQQGLLELLRRSGSDLSGADAAGRSPLAVAAESGKLAEVKLLVELLAPGQPGACGVDRAAVAWWAAELGYALRLSCAAGRMTVVRYLVEGCGSGSDAELLLPPLPPGATDSALTVASVACHAGIAQFLATRQGSLLPASLGPPLRPTRQRPPPGATELGGGCFAVLSAHRAPRVRRASASDGGWGAVGPGQRVASECWMPLADSGGFACLMVGDRCRVRLSRSPARAARAVRSHGSNRGQHRPPPLQPGLLGNKVVCRGLGGFGRPASAPAAPAAPAGLESTQTKNADIAVWAVLRYIGETNFGRGSWVGLELDRPPKPRAARASQRLPAPPASPGSKAKKAADLAAAAGARLCRHCGSVDGVRYFDTKRKGHGMFARASSLRLGMD